MNTIRRQLDFLAADVQRARAGKNFAADLHAGIEQRVALVFQFQFKISKRLHCAKKTVARAGNRFARQHAVRDRVFRRAAVFDPAVEVCAIARGCAGFRAALRVWQSLRTARRRG